MTDSITILGGRNKAGIPEKVESVEISSGEIYSIVGFTGSGKSQLISDIEQLAQKDTVTGRQILLNGKVPDYETRYNPDMKIVAQLSQNMNFALEMAVGDFLVMHGESRGIKMARGFVNQVLELVNSLAGEAVKSSDILTRLSGGQSRALMIADVASISNSPVILIDEVENAGIDRKKAMEILTDQGKIVLIVTHDPQLALMGEKRIVMKNGGMEKIRTLTTAEKEAERLLEGYTKSILNARNTIRQGLELTPEEFKIQEEENHEQI